MSGTPSGFVLNLRKFFNQSTPRQEIRFILLGAFIGMFAAILAVGFRMGIESLAGWFYGTHHQQPFWTQLDAVSWWKMLLIPVVSGGLVSGLTKKLAPEAQGHGVPEIIEAVAIRRGLIRLRVTLVKMVASTVSIASGFSVGREGPTALIGASLGSWLGQQFGLSRIRMRMAVACGAAGGIAATFNAPLAGTVFAIELIMRGIEVRYFTPIFFSALVGTVTSHYLLGDVHHLFTSVKFQLNHPAELIIFMVFGAVAGLWGVLYTKILYWSEELSEKIQWNPWIKGAVGGLGVAMTLFFLPRLTGGATWDMIRLPLSLDMDAKWVLILLALSFLKMVTTSWALSTGGSGGVFAPSLVIGGSLGAGFGHVVRTVFPFWTQSSAACYSLVGMGALVAGVTQAPLTAIIIVFELTHNQAIILPMIISSVFAYGLFNHFMSGSIYTLKLQSKGLFLEMGKETGVLAGMDVKSISQEEDEFLKADLSVDEVISHFKGSARSTLPVLDKSKKVLGVISFWDLSHRKPEMLKGCALDLVQKDFKFVLPQDNLYMAFNMISSGDFEYLPVVNNPTDMILEGKLSRRRLLQAYRNALTARGVIDDEETSESHHFEARNK